MKNTPLKRLFSFSFFVLGWLLPFLIVTLQCSWTPEIKTLIHTDVEGTVALETYSDFATKPQHPHAIPETLLKQILQGIVQTQERGVLQELLISNPQPSQVFTPADIEFLTPHLVDAFSKATPEELITFRSLLNTEKGRALSGKVAMFPPTTFFLTLHNTGNTVGNLSKRVSSTDNLLKKTSLIFSQNESMLEEEDVQSLINISPNETWIAIDYSALTPSRGSDGPVEEKILQPSLIKDNSQITQQNLKVLQEEMRELRKKIEAQDQEIQRLQHITIP